MKLTDSILYYVWRIFKCYRNRRYRSRYNNCGISIISMNCTGGILYHDLGLPFLSPTINLYMKAEHFIRFCERMDHYLSVEHFVECKDPAIVGDRQYPVVWLDDILLYLVHYHNGITEAEAKWNSRKARINPDKIVILNNDGAGMTPELLDRFERLPYPKVLFTHLPDPQHPSTFYIRGYEHEPSVGIIIDPVGWTGLRPIDQFDWVDFLNRV